MATVFETPNRKRVHEEVSFDSSVGSPAFKHICAEETANSTEGNGDTSKSWAGLFVTSNNKKRGHDDVSPDSSAESPFRKLHIALEESGDSSDGTEETSPLGSPKETSTPVQVQTKTSTPAEVSPRPVPAACLVWVSVTLMTVGAAFPVGKAAEITKKFVSFIGNGLCRPVNKSKNGIILKIRQDLISKAKNFSFQSYDFKVSQDQPKVKGIIEIPPNKTFNEIKASLEKRNNVANIQLTKNKQAIAVTFTSKDLPLNVNGNQVKPTLKKENRCLNCQEFGHFKGICTNQTKCPHCADNHTHSQCLTKNLKKCANCQGKHSAAYKGCPAYLKYTEKLEKHNAIITNEYQNKCKIEGIKPDMPKTLKVTENQIKSLASLLVGKTEAEIENILTEKLVAESNLKTLKITQINVEKKKHSPSQTANKTYVQTNSVKSRKSGHYIKQSTKQVPSQARPPIVRPFPPNFRPQMASPPNYWQKTGPPFRRRPQFHMAGSFGMCAPPPFLWYGPPRAFNGGPVPRPFRHV
ncbi:uncharacterized protein LOC128221489 [Mya arenaria]|uniref:uncharacterized protein LOC128221489 n=1 Tax=Mya arenaria TaxID=6604 RepID=UPI0022DF01FA|nr:uncharacterized protein LOC128221489 [Mya arenaria]